MDDALTKIFFELGPMTKQELVALYSKMMRERGSRCLLGGPRTAQDYRSAILCLHRDDLADAAHLAEAGPGHENCPMIDWKPVCDWAKQRTGPAAAEGKPAPPLVPDVDITPRDGIGTERKAI